MTSDSFRLFLTPLSRPLVCAEEPGSGLTCALEKVETARVRPTASAFSKATCDVRERLAEDAETVLSCCYSGKVTCPSDFTIMNRNLEEQS